MSVKHLIFIIDSYLLLTCTEINPNQMFVLSFNNMPHNPLSMTSSKIKSDRWNAKKYTSPKISNNYPKITSSFTFLIKTLKINIPMSGHLSVRIHSWKHTTKNTPKTNFMLLKFIIIMNPLLIIRNFKISLMRWISFIKPKTNQKIKNNQSYKIKFRISWMPIWTKTSKIS